jgi:hypothetical protein
VNLIINFLTSLVENKVISTIRGYTTAISSRHDPTDGLPISLHPAVTLWIKGLVRCKGLPRALVPPWNLEVILSALKGLPFKPLNMALNKHLTWKSVFLIAITSARRAGELHALRHSPPYVIFGTEDVTLNPDISFLPKVVIYVYLNGCGD